MNKTKIEYCDRTWNPISGCLNHCPYCFAEKIAKRFCTNEHGKEGLLSPCNGDCKACSEMDDIEVFGDTIRVSHGNGAFPFGFFPTLHLDRMCRPLGVKEPQTVFVGSMADLFGDWVPDEWIQQVFEACEKAPWHRYLFLTKRPERYISLASKNLLPEKNNYWYGTTTETETDDYFYNEKLNYFVSIEPIQGSFCEYDSDYPPKWVIVGAETGTRKDKVIPKREWIENIVSECRRQNVPVFMKDSLAKIWGEPLIQEFPWDVKEIKNGQHS